jgi:uncharacterized protein (TIGR03437 family)
LVEGKHGYRIVFVAAEHANCSFVEPATLYPGLTTSAKPGETILLFANGFGPTSSPWSAGPPRSPASCRPPPEINIGGVAATVL